VTNYDYVITSVRPFEDILVFGIKPREKKDDPNQLEITLLCLDARSSDISAQALHAMNFFFSGHEDHMIWIGEFGEAEKKERYVCLEMKGETEPEDIWDLIRQLLIPD